MTRTHSQRQTRTFAQLTLKKAVFAEAPLGRSSDHNATKGMDVIEAFFFATPPDFEQLR